MLSNYDILDLCSAKKIPLIGVYSKNILPIVCRNGSYIINLANSDENGTHWVSFVIRGEVCLYCDSFGCPPPQEVIKFCKLKCKRLIYNKTQIQSNTATCCGWFCILFIKVVSQFPEKTLSNKAMRAFVSMFHHNTCLDVNTKLLLDYIA